MLFIVFVFLLFIFWILNLQDELFYHLAFIDRDHFDEVDD